ncbi:MAG: zinc ribbon domain-containing protein [Sandaracinaceae bacterium]
MQEKLRALVRLAEIDASARHIEEQLRGIPEELEERRSAVASLEGLLGGQKQQMDDAEALLVQQEEELRLRSNLLAQSKAKSAKARNMREVEASQRELSAVRDSIKDAEAERERLQAIITKSREVLDGPLAELAEQKAALALAAEGSDEKLADLETERAKTVVGRDEYAALVPKRVYRRYERIRHKIFPAVVEVIGGVCQGCRMHIPPQLYNQIFRCEEIYQCQTCQRFLFHADLIDEGDGAPADAALSVESGDAAEAGSDATASDTATDGA